MQPNSPDSTSQTPGPAPSKGTDEALEIIRRKLDTLYGEEPSAAAEQAKAAQATPRSKHQQYMYDLSNSGRSLAEIQQAWHGYYAGLPDNEKHEVWREFYSAHTTVAQGVAQPITQPQPAPQPASAEQMAVSKAYDTHLAPESAHNTAHEEYPKPDPASTPVDAEDSTANDEPALLPDIRSVILQKVRSRSGQKKHKNHQSVVFGLSVGLVTVAVLSFGFFNERFIAPFITPSRAVSSTPIIIDPTSGPAGSAPEIIIPKINVEIPVVYDVKTIEEKDVQEGLERGVVHYATTPLPGEQGNGVIFGHSANNILNKGKYKFAFVLLRKLDINDTFYIQKDGKRYVYKVFEKKVVPPTDISVLNPTDKPATFTLITCDPPGTSLNRLVIVGEQISPDPAANPKSNTSSKTETAPQTLPSNSPTLWSRLTGN